MYNNGGNYGSGHLMGGLNPLQLTSGPTSSSFPKLSFLNSAEQTKFEQLFSQNAASSNQQLTGEAARDIFLRSKLDSEVLAQIWSMSDINASGTLTFPEFALAMYLINMKLTGQNVPSQLPNNLRQEITSAMQPSSNSNVGNPGTTHPGYYSSGPSIPGVTTPLDGPMNGRSMTSQTSGRGGYQANNLGKSQWAVTSEEKAQFDQIFKSLDNAHSGFLSGEKAKQVFTESGLNKSDLGKIWGLADIHNQGKLNSDEFAVAMHLIYAKLAGQEIPKTLPTNLVPPSTKDLSDSVSSLKQMLKTNSSLKRNATLSSPILGIPTLDFDLDSSSRYSEKKALSRDEDVGYVSGNRRKIGTSPKPSSPSMSYSERLAKFDALRKKIKEKQAELDSILTNPSEPSFTSSSNQGADLTDLKVKIRNLQDSIYEISVASNDLPRGGVNQNPENQRVERKQLESEFSEITKELVDLTKKAHTLDEKLASSKLELFKVSDAKLYKTAPPKTNLANLFPFKAAGSNEALSDADRLKQKAAEMLAQRMQALTKNNVSSNDPSAMEAKKRLDTETEKINAEKKGNEKHLREIEDSIHHLQEEIRGIIRRSSNSIEQSSNQVNQEEYEREKKKWDSRFGLDTDIKKFLDEVKEREKEVTSSAKISSTQQSRPSFLSSSSVQSVAGIPSKDSVTPSKPSLLSSAKSKEEKDRIIKEEAERRLKERQSFFQAQLQRTKEQKSSLENKVETVENNTKTVTNNSYTQDKLSTIEHEKPQSTSNVPPPPPPPPASSSANPALGGYKTLWLNKPSSTETKSPTVKSTIPSFLAKSNNPFPNVSVEKAQSPVIPEPPREDSSEDEDDEEQERLFRERIEKAKHEEQQKSKVQSQEREVTHNTVQASLGAMQGSGSPVTKSAVPSFLSKSNNQFPSSTIGKIQSPVIPEPSKEDSSDDEDDEEQERLFRERIEKAKLEEQESKHQLHQQEVTPPISRDMTPNTKSKVPSFLNGSNNVFTAASFNAQPIGPVHSLSESSHSPKDDEWDVVEKEPTSPTAFDFNPTPGHTQHLASSLFSSTSQSPSNVSASSTSKFDEAFGGSLYPSESNNSFSPTAFDDAFDIPSKPYTNPQESNDQPQQHTDSASDEVLFRVRALYDYQTAGADDLGFVENDYIQVSQTNDDGDWWYGKLESNGAKGWFPKSYVEQDVGTPKLPDFSAPAKPFVARVLYDYQAQQSDELSVNADAQIDILEKIDENWWRAQVEGHIGLVPSTYCEELIQ